jgi:hypothetical protein
MSRQLLVVILVAVFAGTAFGFALGATSEPQRADAATSADIVKELRKVNSKLSTLNKNTGQTQQDQGTVRGLLTIICDYTASIDCSP